mmetsp:Transcript_141758/g.317542  ORF Transcript_141758/g.317542 Transcript_141758/m.317542 type:complete len:217 (-) Transcript_141758:1160-1810(-)
MTRSRPSTATGTGWLRAAPTVVPEQITQLALFCKASRSSANPTPVELLPAKTFAMCTTFGLRNSTLAGKSLLSRSRAAFCSAPPTNTDPWGTTRASVCQNHWLDPNSRVAPTRPSSSVAARISFAILGVTATVIRQLRSAASRNLATMLGSSTSSALPATTMTWPSGAAKPTTANHSSNRDTPRRKAPACTTTRKTAPGVSTRRKLRTASGWPGRS